MFQHMTDMALSHTATKTQLTALKQEHEALKKDYTSVTSLKEDHTALKEDYTALKEDYTTLKKDYAALKEYNRTKTEVKGLALRERKNDESASTITTSQLLTLLVDTSTMETGSTLSLALSESNTESGYHYIMLEGYKFKLEWKCLQKERWIPQIWTHRRQQTLYIESLIRLYSVTDETYHLLSEDWGCEFKISLNNTSMNINSIFFGTPEGDLTLDSVGGDDQLLGSVTLESGDNITAPTLTITANKIFN